MRSLGEEREAVAAAWRSPLGGGGMAEHRQGEGRLGDEDIAGHGLEGRAGGVRLALVVAARPRPGCPAIPAPPGREPSTWPAGASRQLTSPRRDALAPAPAAAGARPAPSPRRARMMARVGRAGQHGAVAGAGVVGMAMGDDGALDRTQRVDEETTRGAVEPCGQRGEPGFGVRTGHRKGLRMRTPATIRLCWRSSVSTSWQPNAAAAAMMAQSQ